MECADFNDVKWRFYQVPSLQKLFKNAILEVILGFLESSCAVRLLCKACDFLKH